MIYHSRDQYLNSRGGRNFTDVGSDETGEFIVMTSYNKSLKKVYLPTSFPYTEKEE